MVRTINHEVFVQIETSILDSDMDKFKRVLKSTYISQMSGIAPTYISLAFNKAQWQNKQYRLNEQKFNDGMARIAEQLLTANIQPGDVVAQLKQYQLKLQPFSILYMPRYTQDNEYWMRRHACNPRCSQYNRFKPEDIDYINEALHELGRDIANCYFISPEE